MIIHPNEAKFMAITIDQIENSMLNYINYKRFFFFNEILIRRTLRIDVKMQIRYNDGMDCTGYCEVGY